MNFCLYKLKKPLERLNLHKVTRLNKAFSLLAKHISCMYMDVCGDACEKGKSLQDCKHHLKYRRECFKFYVLFAQTCAWEQIFNSKVLCN